MSPLNLGATISKATLPIRNESGGALAAGDLVYQSGWSETNKAALVSKADADAGGKHACFVMAGALANNTTGLAYKEYRLTGVNTNGATVGDPVYLDTTAGGWTLTAPTASGAFQQVIGRVAVVNATTGEVEIDLSMNEAFEKTGSHEVQAAAIAALIFISTEQTGTGSAQNIAHGLGVTPSKVVVVPTDLAPATTGQYTVTEGTHDGTNVVVTVTSSKKFKVIALP